MVNEHVLHYGGKNKFFLFSFWYRVFIYWAVRELFLPNTYKMIFRLLILWPCTFKIQYSLIYFLNTQISFIKHILQNYCINVFLDFNFNCHSNEKLNQNNGCNNVKGLQTSKKCLKSFN